MSLDVLDGTTTAVQRQLRRAGLGSYERSTAATLLTLFGRQRRGFVFFDVGANIGLYSALCALLYSPGRVVAFEPTPSTADIARRIAAANGLDVVVEEVAVGRDDGWAPLYLSATSDASNSLVEGFKRNVGTHTVPVVSLDSYASRTGDEPDVIKIDTESFESAVIDGGRRLLERRRPALVVEVLRRRGHDHGAEIDEAMAGLGYSAYRLSSSPTWRPEARISGAQGSDDRDWLLVPEPLPRRFPRQFERWRDRLAATDRRA